MAHEINAVHEKWRGAIGFLLSQVGAHATYEFSRKIKPLGLSPSHAGILRLLNQFEGQNQTQLAKKLALLPSRLVILVDELSDKGLLERREDGKDRRSYALHLTEAGRKLMGSLGSIAREHSEALSQGLNEVEKKELSRLLQKVAAEQGLTPLVHPGYKNR